ncbi:Os02g0592966 [Oryza sativa Japonica Group]|nr:Os02g0592966 [Oryza sativa Japonica Group]
MAARWLAVTAVSSGCGDGDRDCDWRRHGGLRRLAEGVADGRTWLHGSDWRGRRPAWRREAQPMAVVAGKAREAWSVARRPAWRERRNRWREAGLAREARPVVEEAGVA